MGEIHVHTNLSYGQHRRSLIDLYLPIENERPPLVMMIHGGGWFAGHRIQYATSACELAKRGIAAASVGYPLLPDMVWPETGHEIHIAAVWLADHAPAYGYDGGKIITWGSSAGAQLALTLQAFSRGWEAAGVVAGGAPEIIGTVAHCAAFDLVSYDSDHRRIFMNGAAPETCSPAHIDPSLYRSIFVVHSKPDRLFPYEGVHAWVERLRSAGVDTEMYLSEEGEHGFMYEIWSEAARAGFRASVDYVTRRFGMPRRAAQDRPTERDRSDL